MKALTTVFGLILLVPSLALGVNDGFYCGQRIVSVGDPVWEVGRKCPEPFWTESYDKPLAADRHGRVLELARVEVWTLNFGANHFMRRLEFVNGRLSRVHEVGYGMNYQPGSRRCGPLELNQAGETIAEVFARCGLPDHSYEIPSPRYYNYYGSTARQPGERRVWTYEFGPRLQPRELLFVDGRLRRVSIP